MSKRKRKTNKLISYLAVIVVIISCVFGYFYSDEFNQENNDVVYDVEYNESIENYINDNVSLVVNFFDVGQGDSEFICLPDGKCMLIDASTNEYGSVIADKIKSLGYTKIDYLVATHPHADHIGGMKQIVECFDIGEIYMPNASTNTKTYENLLIAIAEKGLSINTAKAGKTIYQQNDLLIELLAPVLSSYSGLNNYSAVVRIKYGDNVFLFMGDAEDTAENDIFNKYGSGKLKADVLKVGHHGSETASSYAFISAVSPKYAVIEVGKDNSYGHPHTVTLDILGDVGATIFRTDINSNITIISDKSKLTVLCEKE